MRNFLINRAATNFRTEMRSADLVTTIPWQADGEQKRYRSPYSLAFHEIKDTTR
jgi:hypothetical protein